MPVLAVGGKGALGQAIPDQAQLYAGDVTGAELPCGHWVAEESPELLLEQLLPFLGQPNEHDTLHSDQAVTNRSRRDGNPHEFRSAGNGEHGIRAQVARARAARICRVTGIRRLAGRDMQEKPIDGELIRLYAAAVRVDFPRMIPRCLSSSRPELRHRKRSTTHRGSAGAQT